MVLVERYVAILTEAKARVHEVVAITFTEKAASELKRKISDSISRKIAAADLPRKHRLQEIRDQLSAAVVETIHSFCARTLRDYPVEAGVDAAFSVLDIVDQQVMLDAAIKETFDAVLREKEGSERRAQLFDLLRACGKNRVISMVHALAKKREQVGRWLVPGGIYTRGDEEILKGWREHLAEFIASECDDPQLMSDLDILANAAQGKTARALREDMMALKRSASQKERLSLLAQVMKKILTTDGELRKKVLDEGINLADEASRVRATYKAVMPLVDFVLAPNDDRHRILLKHSRTLLDLYQIAIERYEHKKLEGAYLDFEDLQLRTKNLLRDEKIRGKLSRRYKYIMVDEYQDTNALQYEILLPFVSNLAGGNLFIVGDPKQSIYGFRNADVTVFTQTKSDIENAADRTSSVVLSESFRLLRDVVAFVNVVFARLMASGENEFEVEYEPLVRGRENDHPGRVELLVCEPPAADGANHLSQGEMIARRILQLRDHQYMVFDKNETPRSVEFRDIAVLLRSRTSLGDVEEAFIRHHVPYLVTAGVGYFQTQGIYDFYNYFSFLLNTDDDVALTGILRSPFFNVSDAELYEVAREKRSRSLWKALTVKGGKADRYDSLRRAVRILREDLSLASRLSVPELINRITTETAYAGYIAGVARSEQILANLEKLKRVARNYEGQGFTNLYDFTGRLKRLIAEEEQEGQAPVDVLADAVKIMTMHAAKGLEFPVVILPSLDRTFRSDSEPYLDDQHGMAFTPSMEEKKQSIPITEFLKWRTRAKAIAEEKRVFYVACTRARDMLILSGKPPGSSNSYMKWLYECLQLDGTALPASVSLDVTTECLQANEFTRIKHKHRLDIPVLREEHLRSAVVYRGSSVAPASPRSVQLEPLSSERAGEIFSASKIRTYVECPSKYYLRYVAGLPAKSVRLFRDDVDEERDVEIPADLRGRAFHSIMQRIDSLAHDTNTITDELRKFILRDSFSILSEPSIELEALARSIAAVLDSQFWNDARRGTDVRTEFTIMAALGKDFLTGTLDRIYRDARGVWNVLDYKTDSLGGQSVHEKAKQYEPQVKFYSLLVHKFFSAPDVHATLLFSASVNEPVQFRYPATELHRYEEDVRAIIANIHSENFARNGKPCSTCPFLPHGCPPLSGKRST
jgi:ATP-dependent helicase/nuclease subunit A